jgi:hypothetical protein
MDVNYFFFITLNNFIGGREHTPTHIECAREEISKMANVFTYSGRSELTRQEPMSLEG